MFSQRQATESWCDLCMNERLAFVWSDAEETNLLSPCPRCQEDLFVDMEQKRRLRKLQPWTERLERDLGIYRTAVFDDVDLHREFVPFEFGQRRVSPEMQRENLREAYRAIKRYAENPNGWIYLWGPRGTGKSLLAAAAANLSRESGRTVAYVSAPQLLFDLRAGFKDNTTSEQIDHLQQANLVVIDDLGAEQATEWAIEQLFLIFNARYQKQASTVVTSNVALDRLPESYGRIADRLRQAENIPLITSSMRPVLALK
jgi:DNA replication protein DnaC